MSYLIKKFTDLGLPVLDCQQPDRFTGIFSGYIVFEHDGEEWEVDYDEAIFLNSKADILEHSKIYEGE